MPDEMTQPATLAATLAEPLAACPVEPLVESLAAPSVEPLAAPAAAPPDALAAMLAAALAQHRAGALAEAERTYRAVLARDPAQAGALRLLGALAIQTGRHAEAEPLLARALELEPGAAESWSNRGVALQSLGRAAEAIAAYDRAVALRPDYAEAWFNRASPLKATRRLEEALASYDQAIRAKPDYAEAWHQRGAVLRDLQRWDAALASHDRALAVRPGYAEAAFGRGVVLWERKDIAGALAAYDQALAIRPDFAEALSNRGVALQKLERFAEALDSFDRALALRPDYSDAEVNRASVLQDQLRFEDALAVYDRVLARRPELADVWTNRGNALRDMLLLEPAVQSYDRALALKPDSHATRANRGMVMLLAGRFREGWADRESRWLKPDFPSQRPVLTVLPWAGEPVAGKHVIVHAEQGLGDTIQFIRYLPLLAARGARITFAGPAQLLRLLRPMAAHARLTATLEAAPVADFIVPLLSLPLHFGTELHSVPAATPYLAPEPELAERWRARIGAHGFKVGISWQGNPRGERGRSATLGHFAALAAVPGVRLISLQKNTGAEQLAALPQGMQVESLGADFDAGPDAFIDSAAVLASLDLVITIDTAIAHLAGALGRPTWVALKQACDWRWLLGRNDSPWYPGMRLFRQPEHGAWDPVFAAIAAALPGQVARAGGAAPNPVPLAPVSWGELIDKITILQIKSDRLTGPAALGNVRRELAQLEQTLAGLAAPPPGLAARQAELRAINERLWEIEDRIREHEAAGRFDADFIALARAVYVTNDARAQCKRQINAMLASGLTEEKQYAAYAPPAGVATAPPPL